VLLRVLLRIGWTLIAVSACSSPSATMLLPELESFETMLIERSATVVEVHAVSAEPAVTLAWEPAAEPLRIDLFRGTIIQLELEVADGLLVLDPSGVAPPVSAASWTIDETLTIRSDVVRRLPITIARSGCLPLTFEPIVLPTGFLKRAYLAPDGRWVIAIDDSPDPAPAFVLGSTASAPLGLLHHAFAAKGLGLWLVEPTRLVRIGASLEVLEAIDTSTLAIVSAAENAGTPRFFVLTASGEFFGWEGHGALTPIGRPGRAFVAPDLFVRPDGELWALEGPNFARFTPGAGWFEESLGNTVDAFTRLTETSFGTLLGVYNLALAGAEGRVLVRHDDRWEPLIRDGLTLSPAVAELGGRLYGAVNDAIVEIHPGSHEREASVCRVKDLSPLAGYLVTTTEGIFVYASHATAIAGFLRR